MRVKLSEQISCKALALQALLRPCTAQWRWGRERFPSLLPSVRAWRGRDDKVGVRGLLRTTAGRRGGHGGWGCPGACWGVSVMSRAVVPGGGRDSEARRWRCRRAVHVSSSLMNFPLGLPTSLDCRGAWAMLVEERPVGPAGTVRQAGAAARAADAWGKVGICHAW